MHFSKFSLVVLASSALVACNQDDSGPAAATVNGQDIPLSKIDQQLEQVPAELLAGRETNIRTQILDQLIQQALVLQKADELGIENDEAYTSQVEAFENQLKYNLTLQKHLEETLTDDVVRKAYADNSARLAYPAVRARHILVPSEQEAKDIIKVATAANFAELAKEKSTGPSGPQGGDLGYFKKEAMVPAFADVAFATDKGVIAASPVQTQFGWHVVFVEDKQDAFVPPFETVSEQLKQSLVQPKAQEYVAELRNSARITFAETAEPAAAEPAATLAE